MTFINSLENRRTIYALGKNVADEAKAIETIKSAVRQSPSAFNSQTGRVLIVTGAAQEKLWDDIVAPELQATMKAQGVPDSAWEGTRAKLDGFKAAFGTALFFEDQAVVKNLQEQFPLYADNFPVWSEQGSGIITVNAWTALAEIGLGANLQHYNPVIDEAVAKTWNLPESWKLRGQLVFGSIEAPAGEKTFLADEERFIVAN
ncbi:nitroreductase family protein [Lactococcus kimchii]|uniref:nitroreductase family protein n=1 Tax=Lactococcus sp. S-13 TaxID=2507158 RepID=UPI001022A3F1|nr:nitroreductase family protein [Lactococcus sp. S-13]RZI49098.1 nitroreductase family protein [Lactococcus sp. S-13]